MKSESDRKCVNYARVHASAQSFDRCEALAWSNTIGSPQFTDFPSNLIGREYETNGLRILRKSGPARALDPRHRPEGSWALGTRMLFESEKSDQQSFYYKRSILDMLMKRSASHEDENAICTCLRL